MAYRDDLKALHILRQNIRQLLAERHESAAALALHLGYKNRASVTKFLNDQRTGFEMGRLDKLSSWFGLPVYQLFQPGISRLTERRHGSDRRSGHDRRVGHARRSVVELRASLPPERRHASNTAETQTPTPTPLHAAVERLERDIARLVQSGAFREQDPTPHRAVAAARPRARAPRGPHARTPPTSDNT